MLPLRRMGDREGVRGNDGCDVARAAAFGYYYTSTAYLCMQRYANTCEEQNNCGADYSLGRGRAALPQHGWWVRAYIMPRAGEAGHGRGAVVLFGTCLPYVSICPFPPNVEGVAVVGVIAAIEGRLTALLSHEGFCEGYKNNAPHVPNTGSDG